MKSEELNPISKTRIIVDAMTKDRYIACKLMYGISHNLTGEQVHKLYDELKNRYKQLKLDL
tara:strand:+ start:119 stop:301 length:183 start_codon:yes stop_codon:yes gene_type:complete